jgi:hypothetical protein
VETIAMPRPTELRRKLSVACLIGMLTGCAPEASKLRQSIAHPGPAVHQRAQAIEHDPYLLDDVGPEVVGARPREYQRPLNEVVRAEMNAAVPPGIQPPKPPGMPVGPPYAAPVGASMPVAPAPIVTTAPPAAPAPQSPPYQYQQRPPY